MINLTAVKCSTEAGMASAPPEVAGETVHLQLQYSTVLYCVRQQCRTPHEASRAPWSLPPITTGVIPWLVFVYLR